MPSKIDLFTLRYMRDEITKEAFLGTLGRSAARSVGQRFSGGAAKKSLQGAGQHISQNAMGSAALTGAGAGAGGLGGAAVGAIEGAQDGGGIGGALTGAMERGYQGALGGAALGGVAGMAGGGRTKAVQALTSGHNPMAVMGRFGQRQLHSVTGMVSGGAKRGTKEYADALRGMKLYGWDSAARAEKATKAFHNAQAQGMKGPKLDRLRKSMTRAKTEASTNEEALQKGLTSVPGLAREIGAQRSLKPLWSHGVKPQITQQGVMGKAMVGLPVAAAAPELFTAQDEEGRGRGERFSKALTQGLAYTATPFIPMAGSDLLARGGGSAAGMAGKGIDELIGAVGGPKKHRLGDGPGAVPPTDGDAEGGLPVERVMSNAAQGLPPEDMMV